MSGSTSSHGQWRPAGMTNDEFQLGNDIFQMAQPLPNSSSAARIAEGLRTVSWTLGMFRQANNPGITDPVELWFTRRARLFRDDVTVDQVQNVFNRIDKVNDDRWDAIIVPFLHRLPPTEVVQVQNAEGDQPSSLESGSARGGDQRSSSLGSGDAGGEF